MFRSDKLLKSITTLNLYHDPSIKSITVANPEDSRSICTIHDLQFKTSDETKVWLFMDETSDSFENSETLDVLKINPKEEITLSKCNIEVLEEKHTVDAPLVLTSKNYAILLPGGCLTIVTEKNIVDADITIKWSVEEF
jgi:hypothetical protein